jgi:uroporphyrinogen decarboxylase
MNHSTLCRAILNGDNKAAIATTRAALAANAEDLLDRIMQIQVRVSMRFVAAGVDAGYFGDDYGAQRAMLFSPRLWRTLIKPRPAKLFAVFVGAGLPVILHSDGDIRAILPDLVEIGLTTLNRVQPEVLDHALLRRNYDSKLSFYGGVSTRGVLPGGTVEEVCAATIARARALAPERTGLLLGASHRMQSDIPPRNVEAMLDALDEACY